ncbi:hypothetical protein KSP40_PGU009825 [Platanthera guangdongensis]|uniref:Uncharacterized protein n=1 Tax=Platanthera guangdongensis TaxID=2320717 RepID=A0ABR2N1R5_9ASPA
MEPIESADSSPPKTVSASPDADPLAWTRRDARFVKDVPTITPVAYPSRVAPLPEDRVETPKYAEGDAEHGDLRNEARKIRSDAGVRSYLGLMEEEIIPFPTLIKIDKRPTEVPMDLTTAIRKVKVSEFLFWAIIDCVHSFAKETPQRWATYVGASFAVAAKLPLLLVAAPELLPTC